MSRTDIVKLFGADPPKPSPTVTSTKYVDGAAGAEPQIVPFGGPMESQDAFVETDHASVSLSGSVPLKSRTYGLPVWTESEAIAFEMLGPRFRTETCCTAVVTGARSPAEAPAEKEQLKVPRVPITRARK